MGKQSARMVYQGKDHKDIFFNGKYHWSMYKGSKLVWEKLAGDECFVTADTSVHGGLRTLFVDVHNKDYFDLLPRHEGILLFNNLDFCFGLGPYNGEEHIFTTIDGLHYKLGDEFQYANLSVGDKASYGFTKDSFYYIVQKNDKATITQFYIDGDFIARKGDQIQFNGYVMENTTSVKSDILVLKIANFGNNGNFTITYFDGKNLCDTTSAIPYMGRSFGISFCINNIFYGIGVSDYYVPNVMEKIESWLSIKLCDIKAGTAGAYKCINLTGKGVSSNVTNVFLCRGFFYVYYSIQLDYSGSLETYCAKISKSGYVITNKKIEYRVKAKSKDGQEMEFSSIGFTQKVTSTNTAYSNGRRFFNGAAYFKNGIQMEKEGIMLVNSSYFVFIDNMFFEDSENNFFVNVED